MPLYMLDTNICIYLMKNHPPSVAEKFAQFFVGDVVMSAITFAELQYGVSVSKKSKQDLLQLKHLIEDIEVMPFDESAAIAYAPIRTATKESKKDHLDKLIAAHAVSLGITLVTNNVKDFARYPGLKVENWL
jgi:tRNA(fMet)-specific endonuclease VapC